MSSSFAEPALLLSLPLPMLTMFFFTYYLK
jgi:hypothetical protein